MLLSLSGLTETETHKKPPKLAALLEESSWSLGGKVIPDIHFGCERAFSAHVAATIASKDMHDV